MSTGSSDKRLGLQVLTRRRMAQEEQKPQPPPPPEDWLEDAETEVMGHPSFFDDEDDLGGDTLL